MSEGKVESNSEGCREGIIEGLVGGTMDCKLEGRVDGKIEDKLEGSDEGFNTTLGISDCVQLGNCEVTLLDTEEGMLLGVEDWIFSVNLKALNFVSHLKYMMVCGLVTLKAL